MKLRDILQGKKGKGLAVAAGGGLFLVLLLMILAVGGGKGRRTEKVKLQRPGAAPSSREDELDRILKELQQARKETGPKLPEAPARPEKSRLQAPSAPAVLSPAEQKRYQRLQAALQKESLFFQLEAQRQDLKIKKLELRAKYLSALAQLKGAEKKLLSLQTESSDKLLVYEAEHPREGEENPGKQVISLAEQITIPAGTFLDGIVQNQVVVNDGEVAPVVVVLDRTLPDLYHPGKTLLPRGTRFVGETTPFNAEASGLLMVFHTMVLPDGRHVPLKGRGKEVIQVSNLKGRTRVASSVNHHFLELLGKSALVGLASAGAWALMPYGYGTMGYGGFMPYPSPIYSWPGYNPPGQEGEGQPPQPTQVDRTRMAMASALSSALQGLSRSPALKLKEKTTITLRAGERVKLFFNKKITYEL